MLPFNIYIYIYCLKSNYMQFVRMNLEKNGDLISQMYLEINIPDVLSNNLIKDIDVTNPKCLRFYL